MNKPFEEENGDVPKMDGLARAAVAPGIVRGGDDPIKSASVPEKLLRDKAVGRGGDNESLVLDILRACSLSMTCAATDDRLEVPNCCDKV